MARTITVKGVGKVKTAPDLVVISMDLKSEDRDYEKALELAARKIEDLNLSLESVGFGKKAAKIVSFDTDTDCDHVTDKGGNFSGAFRGYVCRQSLKLEFDFNSKGLPVTLDTLSKCLSEPELSVSFTAKDPSAVRGELLKSATANARDKAGILREAAGRSRGICSQSITAGARSVSPPPRDTRGRRGTWRRIPAREALPKSSRTTSAPATPRRLSGR